jgi:hypothetical protein
MRSLLPLKRYYQIETDQDNGSVVIAGPAFKVVLHLSESDAIALGSLTMPTLQVSFEFEDTSRDEVARFWSRFELCFRRGGG